MSLPVTTFYCTGCDFQQGNAGTWGIREYVLPNGVRLPVDWRLGWCEDCAGLAAVEVLSEDGRQKDLKEAEAELAAHPPRPVRRWWQLHRFVLNSAWRNRIGEWGRARLRLQSKLDDAHDALDHIRRRSQARKCLACGSHRVHAPLVTNAEPWNDPEQPQRTGFVHPGCGGGLWMLEDGMRFALKPSVRRYSPEGDLIEKEFVDGYSIPDFGYLEDRDMENALARGRVTAAAMKT